MSSVLKATIENKTTSVTTHFKEIRLTTGNDVFIVSVWLSQLLSKVTVTSCSFYNVQKLCPPCCWTSTTHSSRRRHWPMARSMKHCDIHLTFHKVVYRHTWDVVGSLMIVLLQIFSWFLQWNNCENRYYLVKLRRTKMVPIFWATLYKLLPLKRSTLKTCL